MNINDWNTTKDFYEMLNYSSQYTTELEQRSVSTEFCKLIVDRFNSFEKKVFEEVKKLSNGQSCTQEYEHLKEELEATLPDDGESKPASVLIWALLENTDGYPAWYASSIICHNLIELKVVQKEQLCDIIRDVIPYKKLKEIEQ